MKYQIQDTAGEWHDISAAQYSAYRADGVPREALRSVLESFYRVSMRVRLVNSTIVQHSVDVEAVDERSAEKQAIAGLVNMTCVKVDSVDKILH